MIIPEGSEPPQFLCLFKGKFIIHTLAESLKVSPKERSSFFSLSPYPMLFSSSLSSQAAWILVIAVSSTQACRLYKLSGNTALSLKAIEVEPKASSLSSSHSFFVLVEGNISYVWSGQFSDKALRRGALVIAKLLTKSK